MINPSCIKVPSPEEIHHMLFPRDPVTTVSLPPVWTARVLLTPAGGLRDSPIVPSDQLVIGNLIYDASAPSERLMRIRLYLLESRNYKETDSPPQLDSDEAAMTYERFIRCGSAKPVANYYEAVRPSPAHRYFRPRGWSRLCLFP